MVSILLRFFVLFTSLGLLSCEQISEEEINGSWKLLSVFDEGDSIAMDLSVACLELAGDRTFRYILTEQEKLEGTYLLDNKILNLRCENPADTIRVQILEVSAEQMTLRMNHDGIERKIALAKQPNDGSLNLQN